ncbi:hypothetical protein PILCRDRAFT_1578 [Piloderma croceum F 1598]|uniref:Uncharacterized protein n=1 Tax=Piloderma croceum (strain F 1598) TaxID=765440 RepID=A0A0C3GHW8_PILCF|nr:hypothetical protein PILCRDRAFT_1578 [Piloderma croceum F 1598]
MVYAPSVILAAAIALNIFLPSLAIPLKPLAGELPRNADFIDSIHPIAPAKGRTEARTFAADLSGGFVGDFTKEAAEVAIQEGQKAANSIGLRSFDNDAAGELAGVPEDLALRWIREYLKREMQGGLDTHATDLEQN